MDLSIGDLISTWWPLVTVGVGLAAIASADLLTVRCAARAPLVQRRDRQRRRNRRHRLLILRRTALALAISLVVVAALIIGSYLLAERG